MTKKMYLSLAQVYLEVACEVVHLSKKDNELSMNSICFIMIYFSYDIHVILMPLSPMLISIVE